MCFQQPTGVQAIQQKIVEEEYLLIGIEHSLQLGKILEQSFGFNYLLNANL